MRTIDLCEDAKVFRRELESSVKSIAAAKPASLSALEIGYSCDQSGWIFIHADERPTHERDGQWTTSIDEDSFRAKAEARLFGSTDSKVVLWSDFKRAAAIYRAPKRWICGTLILAFIQSAFFRLDARRHPQVSYDEQAKLLDGVSSQ